LPESQDYGYNENNQKNSFKSKKMSDFLGKKSGLLHAAPSTLENNLNADIFWHLNAHQLAECTLICININKTLVNT
jgi:hypothetical protein